jgi:aerobic-type carbon monoxide dehydrogenase small subunit (CoxS/CutS family)
MVLDVNRVKHQITADPDVSLLNVLRNHLDLTGSKYGALFEKIDFAAGKILNSSLSAYGVPRFS